MKQIRQSMDVQEPIGIVIADGAKPEVAPRFSAFVWGPAPTEVEEERKPAAA